MDIIIGHNYLFAKVSLAMIFFMEQFTRILIKLQLVGNIVFAFMLLYINVKRICTIFCLSNTKVIGIAIFFLSKGSCYIKSLIGIAAITFRFFYNFLRGCYTLRSSYIYYRFKPKECPNHACKSYYYGNSCNVKPKNIVDVVVFPAPFCSLFPLEAK